MPNLIDEVKSQIHYCPVTGELRWAVGNRGRKKGDLAGSIYSNGYRRIYFKGVRCPAHRVAWMLFYGYWPDAEIDHINGIRDDNRIENLRIATKSQNQQNKSAWKTDRKTSSRFIGCNYHSVNKKWNAGIKVNGKRIWLGTFDTEIEAANAYKAAKKKYHKFNPIIRDGAE